MSTIQLDSMENDDTDHLLPEDLSDLEVTEDLRVGVGDVGTVEVEGGLGRHLGLYSTTLIL